MTKQWPYRKLAAECVIATEQMECIMHGKGYCLSARGTRTELFFTVQYTLSPVKSILMFMYSYHALIFITCSNYNMFKPSE